MDKPNVIIILTDDQGYGDLGCMGSADLKTPNLDAIAENLIIILGIFSLYVRVRAEIKVVALVFVL